jgi:hypothetical protein
VLTKDITTGNIFSNGGDTGVAAASTTIINVNGGDGNDTINLSALTTADYASSTLNGDAGNDTIIGGQNNNSLFGGTGNDVLAYSVAAGGTGINLTSMGRTGGAGTPTVWRLRNGTGSALTGVTLKAYGGPTIFTGDLAANTDTFVVSYVTAGPATHIFSYLGGSKTKAAGNQLFGTLDDNGNNVWTQGSVTNVVNPEGTDGVNDPSAP